jgi:uncharacterized MAPEG superfamily protein
MSASLVLLWSIAVAAFLIYVPFVAVSIGRFQVGYDYHAPRALFEKLPPYARRANWAHQNALEVFPIFAAAVLMVLVTERTSNLAANLAVAYLVCRLLHGAFYIADIPVARSLAWVGGMACIAGLVAISLALLN